jgi:hypothetical protein
MLIRYVFQNQFKDGVGSNNSITVSHSPTEEKLFHGEIETSKTSPLMKGSLIGEMNDVFNWKGNFTCDLSQSAHIHLDVNVRPWGLEWTLDSDINDDGNLFTEKTTTIVKLSKGPHPTTVTSKSNTDFDRSQRKLDIS